MELNKEDYYKAYVCYFVKYIIMLLLALLFIYPIVVLSYFKMPIAMNWVEGSYQIKEKAALAIKKPKIVIAGGSSVHFGIRAKMIEQTFKVPTINFGVMALMELDYILYRLKKTLKPGDLVILPLEYMHYSYQASKTYPLQKVYQLLTFDHDFFYHHVPLYQKIRIIFRIHPMMFIRSLVEQLTINVKSYKTGGPYFLKDIDEYGDETASHILSLKEIKPFAMPKFTNESSQLLRDFNLWCQQNKVEWLITFPNVAHHSVYDSTEFKQSVAMFVSKLKSEKFQVLGHHQDAELPQSMMYDTGYHLSSNGIEKRTQRLIKIMRESLSSKLKKLRG